MTACATASVISGLKLGIRRLSELCFCIGMLLMLVVLFYDDTWYLLNLYVQSIGYYLQYVVQLGFHTDAFAQLSNAPDKLEASEWMNDWTIFYWGWWIAWCPFVGMFIAKISRGRTIKEFINATLTAPIFYTFLWAQHIWRSWFTHGTKRGIGQHHVFVSSWRKECHQELWRPVPPIMSLKE